MTTTMTTTAPVEPITPQKAVSSPSLLTLSGIYQTTKSVYVTYMPEAASKSVENIAEKLISASSPYVASIHHKVIQGSVSDEKKIVEEPVEDLDMSKVDALLSNLCSSTDARIGALITSTNSRVHERVESVKSMVTTRVDAIKPAVQTRVDHVRSVVHQGFENERVTQIRSKATDIYSNLTTTGTTAYSTVKDYTPAAKYLVVNAVGQVKEQGAISSAKYGASFLTTKAFEALEAIREQGPITGAKAVVGTWSTGIVGMFTDAKAHLDEEASPVVAPVAVAPAAVDEDTTPAMTPVDAPVPVVEEETPVAKDEAADY